MSQYRHKIRGGVLTREKRGLFLWWRWYFNGSAEEPITKVKNRIVIVQAELTKLQKSLPRLEKAMDEQKKLLSEQHGGTSPPWRDTWSPRVAPTPVVMPGSKILPKKKEAKPDKKKRPIAELVVPD